jgi:predicted RNA-binding protein
LSISLLTACQSSPTEKTTVEKQGLVQAREQIKYEDLNKNLVELQEQGTAKIIDVKISQAKDDTGYVYDVYTIIYETEQ